MLTTAARCVQDTQRAALRFAEADTSGNLHLDVNEFYRGLCPEGLSRRRSVEELQEWLEEAELLDEHGEMSVVTFFRWHLTKELLGDRNGSHKLQALFDLYDGDDSGELDD